MNELLAGLVGALVATNQPLAVSNVIQQNVGVSVSIPNPNDPAEQELEKLMEEDDAALAEVDKWIRDNNAFAAEGAGESKEQLNQRIRARLDEVRKKYQDFLQRYPNSGRGHLAYGTFLDDIGDESGAGAEFDKSAQLDPGNPAAWNNLANYCGESGGVTNAFADYAKAIALDSTEPLYYQNLATTVYLYRRDAMSFYHINEQQVFDKALALYRDAIRLSPADFPLATDYAESYYGIRPLRTNDALAAWTNALHTAHNEAEREGVFIHLARVKIAAGYFDEARTQLAAVTNSIYTDLRNRLQRNLAEREKAATNPVTAGISTNLPGTSAMSLPKPANSSTAAGTATATADHSSGAATARTNTIAESTNPPTAVLTNAALAVTANAAAVPTNPPAILTNGVPARLTNNVPVLTNPPIFSLKEVSPLPKTFPTPPAPSNWDLLMSVPPPAPRASTNSDVGP